MKATRIIELYNPEEKVAFTVAVEQLSEKRFKMVENDILDERLTFGAEFEAKVNSDGKYEIMQIEKMSDLVTRRFFLPPQYSSDIYRMFGDELTKRGGFWQVDMGSYATINYPPELEDTLRHVMIEFGLKFE